MQGTLVFVSAFYNRTGLAGSARAWVKTLHEGGNRVRIISVNDTQPGVDDFDLSLFKELEKTPIVPPVSAVFFHNPSQNWLDVELPEPHVRIMLTGFVGSTVPADWIDLCNKFDQVSVLSNEERINWVNSGMNTLKLSVLPGPNPWLDLPVQAIPPVQAHSDQIRFLSLGTFSPNRRWDVLIEAFLSEFSENPHAELYLRVNYPAWHPVPGRPKEELAELIDSMKQKTGSQAQITVDESLGTRMEIMSLIDSADVYVSCDVAYTATVIEAVCRRVPVIVVEDVYRPSPTILRNAFRIQGDQDGRMIQVEGDMLDYLPQYKGVEWPVLPLEHVRSVLADAYRMPMNERRAKGKQAYLESYGSAQEAGYLSGMEKIVRKAWAIHDEQISYADFPVERQDLVKLGPGINALDRQDYPQAKALFTELVKSTPDLSVAQQLLADTLVILGSEGEAVTLLEQAIKDNPERPQYLAQLAKILMGQERSEAAKVYLETALSIIPEHIRTRLYLAELFYRSDALPEALEQIKEVLQKNSQNLDARTLLAMIQLKMNGAEMADRAFDGIPWSGSFTQPLMSEYLDLVFKTCGDALDLEQVARVAQSLYYEDAFDGAVKWIQLALKRDLPAHERSGFYYLLTLCYRGMGDTRKEAEAIEVGLEASIDNINLRRWAIRESMINDSPDQTLLRIEKFLEKNPEDVDLRLAKANNLISSEQFAEAHQVLADIYAHHPHIVGIAQAINTLAEHTGQETVEVKSQSEDKTMKQNSIYTKDALNEYITKLGFEVGDHSYGAPIIRWWGEDAKLQIGKYCSIASNVKVYLGGNHRHDWVTTYPFPSDPMNEHWPKVQNLGLPKLPTTNGDVIIGDDVWIGDDVSILSGITVGPGAVIAAKSMVTKDVPAFAVVGGNPAKVITYRFPEEVIKELLEIKWWDWPDQKVNDFMPLICSTDLSTFIEAAKKDKAPELSKKTEPSTHQEGEPLFTGERAMPLAPNMDDAIMVEHWARYKLAGPMVKGKRVLDIACGAGYGTDYLAKFAKSVVGGDIDPQTVAYCHEKYQRDNLDYRIMDIRRIPLPDNSLDAIVSFETIEHVEEWEQFLKEINRIVVEDGQLIISTPLGGPCGNHFHLSYFQRQDFKPRLEKYFEDVQISYQRVDKFFKQSISPEYAETFTGEYALAVCSKPIKASRPLVSVVMLTYNALKYTKKCLKSIQDNTRYPYEIIFVDNASTDGTQKYLRRMAKKFNNIHVIENSENKGFAAGNNQGVEAASGKYVLMLNNDVLVAEGWLEKLVEGLNVDPAIGMIGPITNHISGRQMLKEVPYKDDAGFAEFAAYVLSQNPQKVTPRRRIAGFAMLLEKELYLDLGGFDESFGNGNFEDDDLCLRLKENGKAIMVHEGVFMHHYGSQTFKANKMDYSSAMESKGQIFRKKWPDVNYEELIEIENPLPGFHEKKAAEGMQYLEYGNYDEARDCFALILKDDPIQEIALLGMGYALKGQGEHDAAQVHLEHLIKLNPAHSVAYNMLGLTFAEKGDYDQAVQAFSEAMKSDIQNLDAQRNLAELYLQNEKFNEGVQILTSLIDAHPEDVPSLLRMATLNIEAERIEEGLDLVERVLEIDPNNEYATQIKSMLEK